MSFEWQKESQLSREKKEPISRRKFLSYATIGLGSFVAALVSAPLIGSFISPLLQKKKEGAEEWIDLGQLENFKIGEPSMVQWVVSRVDGWVVETAPRAVWVVTKDGQNFTVFNPRCTHLSCAHSWKLEGEKHGTAYSSTVLPDKNHFFCPCHDGIFDIDGIVIGGPPPRPLDTLPVKIENGRLFTIYKDFRAGITEKVEI